MPWVKPALAAIPYQIANWIPRCSASDLRPCWCTWWGRGYLKYGWPEWGLWCLTSLCHSLRIVTICWVKKHVEVFLVLYSCFSYISTPSPDFSLPWSLSFFIWKKKERERERRRKRKKEKKRIKLFKRNTEHHLHSEWTTKNFLCVPTIPRIPPWQIIKHWKFGAGAIWW